MLKIIDTISGFLDAFVSWRHFAPVMGLLACALPTLLLAIQLIMYVAYQPSLGFIRHSKKFVAKYGYVDQYFADKYGKKVVRRAGRNIYRSWRSTVACGDMLAAGDVLVKHVLARPLVPEVFTPSGLIWLLVVQGLGLCMHVTFSAVFTYVLIASAPWVGGFIVKVIGKAIIEAIFSRKRAKAAQYIRSCVGSKRAALPNVDVKNISSRDKSCADNNYSAVDALVNQVEGMLAQGVGQDVAKVISEGIEGLIASGAYDSLESARLIQLNSRVKNGCVTVA